MRHQASKGAGNAASQSAHVDIARGSFGGTAQLALEGEYGSRAVAFPAGVAETFSAKRARGVNIKGQSCLVRFRLLVGVICGGTMPAVAKTGRRAVRKAVAPFTGLEGATANVWVEKFVLPEEGARGAT